MSATTGLPTAAVARPLVEAEAEVESEQLPPRRAQRRWVTPFVYVLLAACTLVFIYPFVWLVSASFKPRGEVFDNRLIPETFTFDNYLQVWQEAPLALWLANSALVTVLATVSVTVASACVAWGFAHYQFRGRNLLFGLVLATMMVPGAVTMIPTYLIWTAWVRPAR